MSTSYSIKWFRENTTGAVKSLGRGIVQHGTDRISRYHKTAFLNQTYSPSLLGKYWCQVINKTADPDQPLMRSNVFTLLAPGNYSGPTCSRVQRVDNIACADLAHSSHIKTQTLTTTQSLCIVSTTTSGAAAITSLTDITSNIAIISTSLSSAHMPSVVTTPNETVTVQQNPFITVIAIMGVVIVIISVVAVTAVVILFIKWRQSVNSSKG